MLFALLPLIYAQERLPPIISSKGSCTTLCDLVKPILWITPLLACVISLTLVISLHISRVRSAAQSWRGGAINWWSVWLTPIFAGLFCMLIAAVILALIGLGNPDFRLLLIMEWQRVEILSTWIIATFVGIGLPPGIAAYRSTNN